MSDEKDGVYCRVCGGIVPQDISVGTIEIDGKPTGINQLLFILDEVRALNLQNDADIRIELVKRAGILNYIPTKMKEKYANALLCAFREQEKKR
ncbi:MAG: NAC family transcription factor [Methanospirillaceae archaeon]|nr:NAC family transcription factor [Methanospirillaceae archaeon]